MSSSTSVVKRPLSPSSQDPSSGEHRDKKRHEGSTPENLDPLSALEELWENRDFERVELWLDRWKERGNLSKIRIHGRSLFTLAWHTGAPASLFYRLVRSHDLNNAEDKKQLTSFVHAICARGRSDLLSTLCDGPLSSLLEERDADGCTPLFLAFENGNRDTIKTLLARKAKVKISNKRGQTLLHVACQKTRRWWRQNVDIIESLVTRGVEINDYDHNLNTPLYYACCLGHAEAMGWLLSHKASLRASYSALHLVNTAIYYSPWVEWKDALEALFSRGVGVDEVNYDGETSLHLACHNGRQDVAEFLIMSGAKVNKLGRDGDAPLHLVCRKPKYLCSIDRPQLAQFLISKGANLNLKGKGEETPLHIACQYTGNARWTQIVGLLLEKGARGDVSDCTGSTPLHIACYNGDLEKAKLLLNSANCKHSLYQKTRESYGHTPFESACLRDNVEIVEFLLAVDPTLIERVDCDGNTAFHFACGCQSGKGEVVSKLLTYNSTTFDMENHRGRRPLSAVVYNPSYMKNEYIIRMVGELLSHGARPLPLDDVPERHGIMLSFLMSSFPMITLYQLLRMRIQGRAIEHLGDLQLAHQSRTEPRKVVKTMMGCNLSWNLHWMILCKAFAWTWKQGV